MPSMLEGELQAQEICFIIIEQEDGGHDAH
jgi:hypothetical protein